MAITTKRASELWGISDRRIRVLSAKGKIQGAELIGRTWYIPDNATKPLDGRIKASSTYINRIEELKEILFKKRKFTKGETEKLNEQFLIEYTFNSNAIKGNSLSLNETGLILKGFTIENKPLQPQLEAIAHKEAIDFISTLVKEGAELSEDVIKQVHSFVLSDKPEDKGVYRKIPITIPGASNIPVHPSLIEQKLQELLESNNSSDLDFISKLAKFHLEFERIHPFIDGNGRTGRLLINFELLKLGYPPIDIKLEDRKDYYEAFDLYFRNEDLEPMIKLLSKYLYENLSKYILIKGES